MAGPIDQIGHGGGGQYGPAFDQNKMKPHTQGWHLPRPPHGIGRGRARHHQTGGREDAVFMGARDRFVDFEGSAEVIGRNDKLPH